jgi:hypothetical protein
LPGFSSGVARVFARGLLTVSCLRSSFSEILDHSFPSGPRIVAGAPVAPAFDGRLAFVF